MHVASPFWLQESILHTYVFLVIFALGQWQGRTNMGEYYNQVRKTVTILDQSWFFVLIA